jgi:L-cysteine desulfidase
MDIYVSGNILKNVKSVVVPNTNGLRGIKAACAIGVVAGNPDLELECISKVTEEDINKCNEYLKSKEINVLLSNSEYIFDIHIFAYHNNDVCEVQLIENHTNIVLIRYNNEIIFIN